MVDGELEIGCDSSCINVEVPPDSINVEVPIESIQVHVPPDSIKVEAVVEPNPVTVKASDPVVVSYIVIHQSTGDTAGLAVQADSHYIHFPPFRPLSTGLAGLEVPKPIEGPLRKSLDNLSQCETIEVTVRGMASRTKFFDPTKEGNIWDQLRKEYQGELSMDDRMNCGLANARAISAVASLLPDTDELEFGRGSVPDAWNNAQEIFDLVRCVITESPGAREDQCSLAPSDCAGKTREVCRAQRIRNLLFRLCDSETFHLSSNDFSVTVEMIGLSRNIHPSAGHGWENQSVVVKMRSRGYCGHGGG